MKNIVLSLLILLFVMGCESEPPPPLEPIIIVQDPLVLQEIAPLPRSVIVAAVKAPEFEPVYTTFRIIEVSEVNGVQKYFLVRLGSDRTGISIGATGDIAEDLEFQKIIGNYKIIEVYGDFFRCEIVELAYRIGSNAYMRVQTGEKIREDAPPA